MRIPRKEILKSLRSQVAKGIPIIGTGAGIGLTAKFEEAGGSDLIIVYNSGRFRMGGRSSMAGMMPYGDANAIVLEMACEILPIVKKTPVLAGVCGTDPMRQMDRFLDQIAETGFSGVQNFPTVCLYDGLFRTNLEETGLSYSLEVEMIRLARGLDLLTNPYVFNPKEARQMADAGADVIVAHVGTTVGGSIGAATVSSLDDSVRVIRDICNAAKLVNPEVIMLCHGGPIATPADAQYVLSRTEGIDGFYGASSAERLPVETAIANHIHAFKSISLSKKAAKKS